MSIETVETTRCLNFDHMLRRCGEFLAKVDHWNGVEVRWIEPPASVRGRDQDSYVPIGRVHHNRVMAKTRPSVVIVGDGSVPGQPRSFEWAVGPDTAFGYAVHSVELGRKGIITIYIKPSKVPTTSFDDYRESMR